MIETLTRESFEPHLNTVFGISSAGYDDSLTLVEVQANHPSPVGRAEPFSLILDGARTDVMYNPSTFALTHPEMGTLDLFMSPIGKNPDGTFRYQIGFN